MAFVFLFIGAVLLVSGVRGTQKELGELIADLFTGPNNLTFWGLAIIGVGSIGYIPSLRKFAIAFMTLVLVSLLIGNQRFFEDLVSQVREGTTGFGLRSSIDENGVSDLNGSDPFEDFGTWDFPTWDPWAVYDTDKPLE